MLPKRFTSLSYVLMGAFLLILFYLYSADPTTSGQTVGSSPPILRPPSEDDKAFQWRARKERYPVKSMTPLPGGQPIKLPAIQHRFSAESTEKKKLRVERQNSIRGVMERTWAGYREHAWMKDELMPVSGSARSHFGGWAATLVDSLDTLWIMGMTEEFEEAVAAVKKIDFSTTEEEELNIFETTIRYLGGLLSAHDLSKGKYPVLLEKAVELGDMLYASFDTPNRMPISRWKWQKALNGEKQEADPVVIVAEIGSLSLEFTRLSQLTGDAKYYDAIQRITNAFEKQQSLTKLPGLWPVIVNVKDLDFISDNWFSLGAKADSLYEYLPKEYMLLGGLSDQYRKLYESAIDVAKQHLFFRPMNRDSLNILISGNVRVNAPGDLELDPEGQHLACFVAGMLGIGSKLFKRPDDLVIARQLINGCTWAYRSMPTGIMPETFHALPCINGSKCEYDDSLWRAAVKGRHKIFDAFDSETGIEAKIKRLGVVPGFTDIPDRRYILRPEAIESLFLLYRITGDESLPSAAWRMFQAIDTHTRTDFGNAALDDVTVLPAVMADSMESFWPAETLKYFYLIYSEPSLIDLDLWVFNTEAHPLRRPR